MIREVGRAVDRQEFETPDRDVAGQRRWRPRSSGCWWTISRVTQRVDGTTSNKKRVCVKRSTKLWAYCRQERSRNTEIIRVASGWPTRNRLSGALY